MVNGKCIKCTQVLLAFVLPSISNYMSDIEIHSCKKASVRIVAKVFFGYPSSHPIRLPRVDSKLVFGR